MLPIIKATPTDLDRIISFYRHIIENTPNMGKYAKWEFGKHPTYEMLREYVEEGSMLFTENTDGIVAAGAVTLYQNEDYNSINWTLNISGTEVAVIHVLCVDPKCQKRGIAKKFMQAISCFVAEKGKKALRLDALCCNKPAHKLYDSLGFRKIDVRNCYATNTGWIDFYYYEKHLQTENI